MHNDVHSRLGNVPKLPFKIERPLGGGAYADVFVARGTKKRIVVKVARAEVREAVGVTGGVFFAEGRHFVTGGVGAWDPDPKGIIDKEAELLEAVSHPAMVRLLGRGDSEGLPYIVLEYIEGENWRDALRSRKVGLAEFHTLVQDLTAMEPELGYHGDLKPENLILDTSGKTRIIDPSSGVTKTHPAGHATALLTSEWYNPLLEASDIPSLGVMLIEVLTGQHPIVFASDRPPERQLGPGLVERLRVADVIGRGERIRRITQMPLPSELSPELPKALETIALRCLGVRRTFSGLDITEPYATVADLAAALAKHA